MKPKELLGERERVRDRMKEGKRLITIYIERMRQRKRLREKETNRGREIDKSWTCHQKQPITSQFNH